MENATIRPHSSKHHTWSVCGRALQNAHYSP